MTPLLGVIIFIKSIVYKKRSLKTFFSLPKPSSQPSIWFHAVSLGEVKTATPFILEIQKLYPNHQIYLSTMTETGFFQGRTLPQIKTFYFPFDFVFLQKKLVRNIKPQCVFFIEGDVWPSLSRVLKNTQISQAVISAKISERSVKRLISLKNVTQFLYENIDLFCLQNETMKKRFEVLGISQNKLAVCGNLKLAVTKKSLIPDPDFEDFLNLDPKKKTIAITCTHEKEEILILNTIRSRLSEFNIILAPRHPQRFNVVKQELEAAGFSIKSYSSRETGTIRFIDTIGLLDFVYMRSNLAIIGGSFVEKIGGHNLIEPIACNCPVIFGPFAFAQTQLMDVVTTQGLGVMTNLTNLGESIDHILSKSSYANQMARFHQLQQDVIKNLISQLDLENKLSKN